MPHHLATEDTVAAAAIAPPASLDLAPIHFFETAYGLHALISNGSQVYAVPPELQQKVEALAQRGDLNGIDGLLQEFGLHHPPFISEPLENPPLRSLSLAVAQACNLGCTYCYAQEGGFGGAAKLMSWEVAQQAVSRLLEQAQVGDRVHLSFLGGEPLINRELIQATTHLAVAQAQAKGVRIGFSITTNGTLLTPEDGEFFERYGFAVTVSLDGVETVHDRQRSFKGGQGSYQRILANLTPLLAQRGRMQLSARVTVTPQNLDLPTTLDQFITLGFHSVGFAPMLSSPTGRDQMHERDLEVMLAQMIECGKRFEQHTLAGQRYPFANLTEALTQIHRGTHRPYSCGAGASYMGVSAEGNLSACHRFVDDPVGWMGNLKDGIQRSPQNQWLRDRQVDHQEPCRQCWAKYLCGGGCHHEVIHRGRPACNYIRGWLDFCLQTYIHLLEACPDYFAGRPHHV